MPRRRMISNGIVRMRIVLGSSLVLWALTAATEVAVFQSEDSEPNPPFRDDGTHFKDSRDAKRGFLSATLGSNMVLQRDRSATIWGFSSPGVAVITTFDGQNYTSTVGGDGVWRQKLPPRSASLEPVSILVSAPSTGESVLLDNVLFGDVYLCGGQSNMQFSMPGVVDAKAEASVADNYPHIRLFTVGTDTRSNVSLDDLQTVWQTWSVASADTVARFDVPNAGFHVFSAVCWYFGKTVSDGLGNTIPIGLVSDNWGGTSLEMWSTRDALDECGIEKGDDYQGSAQGSLYNSMIHPYSVGPMSISGFTWYQGEANTKDDRSSASYACLFPATIRAWRKAMELPDGYFGFVQLSTWCAGPPVAELREAQMAALLLPGEKVGYATAADWGAGCDIHPPFKRPVGERLARSALALNYGSGGKDPAWRSPSYSGATSRMVVADSVDGKGGDDVDSDGGGTMTAARAIVTVELSDVSGKGLYLRDPHNRGTVDCAAQAQGVCAWASIRLSVEGWVNATLTVSEDNKMLLTVSTDEPSQEILESSYGWGSVPMLSVYDAGTELPVLPWKKSMTGVAETKNNLMSGFQEKVAL